MISKLVLLGLVGLVRSEIHFPASFSDGNEIQAYNTNDYLNFYDLIAIALNDNGTMIQGLPLIGACNKEMLATSVSVSVFPYTVSEGQWFVVSTEYYLGERIEGGVYNYKATLSGFPIMNENGDLCEKLAESQTPCPLWGWEKSIDNITIASGTPKGKYSATANYGMTNGTTILCVIYEFTVV